MLRKERHIFRNSRTDAPDNMAEISIDPKRVIEGRIAGSMGFDKYRQIMETVRKTDVSSDPVFQRTFNAFYRIRRNAEWRKAYYDLFEISAPILLVEEAVCLRKWESFLKLD